MKKEKPTLMRVFISIFISTMVYTAAVNAQHTTNWVAINDHHRGTASSPYANFYNPLLNDAGLSGPLTNTVNYAILAQGVQTPAFINITTNGGSSQAGTMGAPNAGTPAGDWFRPYVDFGSGNRDAIQLKSTSTITYTFNGLDPAKRYIFKGTAARGDGSYLNRWTLASIDGADTFGHSHKPTWAEASTSPNFGVLTANDGGTMNANQAAWCSGENRAAGAMIVFTDINPGADGSFAITVQTYKGNVPGGSSSADYGYAFSAFSVEELIVSVNDPIQVTSVPTNQTLLEGQTLNLSVTALGSLPQYQWYKDEVAIPNATNRTYQVLHALPVDSGSYYVRVWNHINSTNIPAVDVVVTSEQLVVTNGLQDMEVFEASTIVLTVGVSGTFPQYQWYKEGQPIIDATNVSLTITNFSPTDAGSYMVLITNSTSQVTSAANLTYISDTIPPRILVAVASTNYLTVDILFSEPVSEEANDFGNYLLIPEVGDPIMPSNVTRTNLTNVTLSFSAGDIQFGNHYSISGVGIYDTSRQFNEIDATPVPIAIYYGNLLLIDESTMWRFESSGYDYSNAWYKIDFDDSGWSNGAALFMSKVGGSIPTLPQPMRTYLNRSNVWGTARVATYYFRTWFNFTGNDPEHSAIAIRPIIDDGAVFYLNGKEVYRLGMPSGTVTASTYANRTIGDPAYEGPFMILLPGLVSGSNLVAVEVHDINATSSDAAFAMEIIGILPAINPVEILTPLSDKVINEGEPLSLSVNVKGVSPIYQWYKDDVPIEGATSSIYTISIAHPSQSGVYKVVVSNLVSVVESSAQVTVTADTTAPRIISAIGSTNYLTIDIIFSEPVSDDANDNWSYSLIPQIGVALTPMEAVKTSPTNVTLTFSAGSIEFGTRYSISASAIFDMSEQVNEIDSTPVPVAMYYVNMLSIDESTMWRFESSGYNYSNAWYQLDFDDSGWSNGAALFVSKTDTIPTFPQPMRTFMNRSNYLGTARVATYYFRTWFEFTGSDAEHSAIAIRAIIDDGAIFYLNGREIYRLGMPSGTVTSSTYANRTIGDAAYEGPFTVVLPGLVSGSNLVAVEVHDVSATSSDVVMGMEIIGILPALTPVEIVTPLSDRVINEGESLVLSVDVKGASPNYQWYKNDIPIEGATLSSYAIAIAKPGDSGVYKVVVSNAVSVVESSALVTVTADTTAPSVISVIASTNLTTIIITFSELVDPFSSQDPNSYVISPIGGGAALEILSAVLTNGTNVIITTTAMQPGVIYSININNVSDVSEAGNTLFDYTQNVFATEFIVPVWTDWKYENTGTDLGSNWFMVDFPDSGWQIGTALFGLESNTFVSNNLINTPFTLTNSSGVFITNFYFRKWFVFPYRTNGVKLAFMHAIDDGAVFYINGVEVYRHNMPEGDVSYNTLASSSIEVSDYTMSPFIEITNLVSGHNLIAVEVHQGASGSSDVLFGTAIIALLPSYEIVYYEPRLDFTVQGKNIIFTWSAPGFSLQQNSDLNTSNWQLAPNGDQSPVTVPIEEGKMFFRLVK